MRSTTLIAAAALGGAIVVAVPAATTPAAIPSIGQADRHPWVTFSAPSFDDIGLSEPTQLLVPEPATRFTATVSRRAGWVRLKLSATALSKELPYKVCWTTATSILRCRHSTLVGSWWEPTGSVADIVEVDAERLAKTTRFDWYVNGKRVATRRTRVR